MPITAKSRLSLNIDDILDTTNPDRLVRILQEKRGRHNAKQYIFNDSEENQQRCSFPIEVQQREKQLRQSSYRERESMAGAIAPENNSDIDEPLMVSDENAAIVANSRHSRPPSVQEKVETNSTAAEKSPKSKTSSRIPQPRTPNKSLSSHLARRALQNAFDRVRDENHHQEELIASTPLHTRPSPHNDNDFGSDISKINASPSDEFLQKNHKEQTTPLASHKHNQHHSAISHNAGRHEHKSKYQMHGTRIQQESMEIDETRAAPKSTVAKSIAGTRYGDYFVDETNLNTLAVADAANHVPSQCMHEHDTSRHSHASDTITNHRINITQNVDEPLNNCTGSQMDLTGVNQSNNTRNVSQNTIQPNITRNVSQNAIQLNNTRNMFQNAIQPNHTRNVSQNAIQLNNTRNISQNSVQLNNTRNMSQHALQPTTTRESPWRKVTDLVSTIENIIRRSPKYTSFSAPATPPRSPATPQRSGHASFIVPPTQSQSAACPSPSVTVVPVFLPQTCNHNNSPMPATSTFTPVQATQQPLEPSQQNDPPPPSEQVSISTQTQKEKEKSSHERLSLKCSLQRASRSLAESQREKVPSMTSDEDVSPQKRPVRRSRSNRSNRKDTENENNKRPLTEFQMTSDEEHSEDRIHRTQDYTQNNTEDGHTSYRLSQSNAVDLRVTARRSNAFRVETTMVDSQKINEDTVVRNDSRRMSPPARRSSTEKLVDDMLIINMALTRRLTKKSMAAKNRPSEHNVEPAKVEPVSADNKSNEEEICEPFSEDVFEDGSTIGGNDAGGSHVYDVSPRVGRLWINSMLSQGNNFKSTKVRKPVSQNILRKSQGAKYHEIDTGLTAKNKKSRPRHTAESTPIRRKLYSKGFSDNERTFSEDERSIARRSHNSTDSVSHGSLQRVYDTKSVPIKYQSYPSYIQLKTIQNHLDNWFGLPPPTQPPLPNRHINQAAVKNFAKMPSRKSTQEEMIFKVPDAPNERRVGGRRMEIPWKGGQNHSTSDRTNSPHSDDKINNTTQQRTKRTKIRGLKITRTRLPSSPATDTEQRKNEVAETEKSCQQPVDPDHDKSQRNQSARLRKSITKTESQLQQDLKESVSEAPRRSIRQPIRRPYWTIRSPAEIDRSVRPDYREYTYKKPTTVKRKKTTTSDSERERTVKKSRVKSQTMKTDSDAPSRSEREEEPHDRSEAISPRPILFPAEGHQEKEQAEELFESLKDVSLSQTCDAAEAKTKSKNLSKSKSINRSTTNAKSKKSTDTTHQSDDVGENIILNWLKDIIEPRATVSSDKLVEMLRLNDVKISPADKLVFVTVDDIDYAYYDTPANAKRYGFMRLHPGARKPRQRAKLWPLRFLNLLGEIQLSIEEKHVTLQNGDLIMVPKGKRYKLKNRTDDVAVLFFINSLE